MKTLLIALTALIITGCAEVKSPYTPPELPTPYEVYYEVTGTVANVSVTYETQNGDTAQSSTAVLPWKHTMTTTYSAWRYISAQNNYSSGSITVKIYKKGILQKSVTSTGAYVIATASGTY